MIISRELSAQNDPTTPLQPLPSTCLDLSKEELLNFQYLASLIKNTSFLESLLLPKIKRENAEEILEILNEMTIENSSLTNIKLNLSNQDDYLSKEALQKLEQIQSRLSRNKKRIFAIHGGGYIGLGLMADIISQSPFEYKICATSSDKFTNLIINSLNQFWIQHDLSKSNKVTCVKNVTMRFSRNDRNIIDLYVNANVLAICLTEQGIIQTSEVISQGLIARYETDQAGLKIFVLMNKPDSAEFIRNAVFKKLIQLTQDEVYTEKVLAAIQFIPTMVDRIVNKIDTNTLLQQLRRQLLSHEPYLKSLSFVDPNLPFDEQIENILSSPKKLITLIKKLKLQVNLFNAELSFVLYVPDGLPEVPRFPAIKAVKNVEQFIMLKNKYVNGPHAILAWLGGLKGYKTIAAAIRDKSIAEFIEKMMQHEIAPILAAEYPAIKPQEFEFLKSAFFKHCRSNKKDLIIRVGRDPLRKLIRGGCIMGVIDLRLKHALALSTSRLEKGIALGILYAIKKIDPYNDECKKIREIYQKNHSYKEILCYTGYYGNGVYPGLDQNQDKKLIQNILTHLEQLTNEKNVIYSPRRHPSRT